MLLFFGLYNAPYINSTVGFVHIFVLLLLLRYKVEDRMISVMLLMFQLSENIFGDGCPFFGFDHLPPKMSVHVPEHYDAVGVERVLT